MKVFFGAVLAATVAMYVVSTMFWVNPWPYQFLERISDDMSVSDDLLQICAKPGVYMLPDPRERPDGLPKLYEQGPIATIFIHPQGISMMSGSRQIAGAFHFIAVSLILTIFVSNIKGSLNRIRHQLGIPLLTGAAAALLCDATGPLWFYHAAGWHFVLALYHWITWTVGCWTIVVALKGRDSFLFIIPITYKLRLESRSPDDRPPLGG